MQERAPFLQKGALLRIRPSPAGPKGRRFTIPPDERGPVSCRDTLGSMARKRTDWSFYSKGQDDVRIIAGPNVWICDECVELCCDIFWPDVDFPWSAPRARSE